MICSKCKLEKPETEFYHNKNRRSGYTCQCKICLQEDKRRYRTSERYREMIRLYEQKESTKERRRIYRHTEHGRSTHNLRLSRLRKLRPDNFQVRNISKAAIRAGKLVPKPCTVCGSNKDIEGHHTDYNKPVDVVWLCKKCHHQWHLHNKAIPYKKKLTPKELLKLISLQLAVPQ